MAIEAVLGSEPFCLSIRL